MKKILVSLIIAGLMLSMVPQTQAINKEWSAALGFLGGVLVANSHYGRPVYVSQPVYVERTVYCQPTYYCSPGRWVESCQKRWVPGYWVADYDCYGNCVSQTWVNGYWINEPVRYYQSCSRCGR